MVNFVRQERKKQHVSQEELARKAGVSQREISKVELGQIMPTIEIAKRIAHALHTSADDLFLTDEEARSKGFLPS